MKDYLSRIVLAGGFVIGSTSIALAVLLFATFTDSRMRTFSSVIGACVLAIALVTALDICEDAWVSAPFLCATLLLPRWFPHWVHRRYVILYVAAVVSTIGICVLGR